MTYGTSCLKMHQLMSFGLWLKTYDLLLMTCDIWLMEQLVSICLNWLWAKNATWNNLSQYDDLWLVIYGTCDVMMTYDLWNNLSQYASIYDLWNKLTQHSSTYNLRWLINYDLQVWLMTDDLGLTTCVVWLMEQLDSTFFNLQLTTHNIWKYLSQNDSTSDSWLMTYDSLLRT